MAAAVVSWRDRVEIAVLVLGAAVPLLLPLVVFQQQFAQVDPSQDSAGITRDGDPLRWGTLVAVLYAVEPWCKAPTDALLSFYFTGPDDGCTSPGCWPFYQQSLALAAPELLAGLSMVAMAFLARRVRWWIRAAVPVAVLLAALGAQYAVWDPYLLPLFQAPPP